MPQGFLNVWAARTLNPLPCSDKTKLHLSIIFHALLANNFPCAACQRNDLMRWGFPSPPPPQVEFGLAEDYRAWSSPKALHRSPYLELWYGVSQRGWGELHRQLTGLDHLATNHPRNALDRPFWDYYPISTYTLQIEDACSLLLTCRIKSVVAPYFPWRHSAQRQSSIIRLQPSFIKKALLEGFIFRCLAPCRSEVDKCDPYLWDGLYVNSFNPPKKIFSISSQIFFGSMFAWYKSARS